MEKNIPRAIVKLCGFVILANLPFLTISYGLGIDTFLDSFEHPDSFFYIKNDKLPSTHPNGGYLILEKPTYQDFSIEEGDRVLCYTTTNTLQEKIVQEVRSEEGVKKYYTSTNDTDNLDVPIYEHQIVGKIKGNIEDNIWNTLCLSIWDLSIDNLNALALFSHQ